MKYGQQFRCLRLRGLAIKRGQILRARYISFFFCVVNIKAILVPKYN